MKIPSGPSSNRWLCSIVALSLTWSPHQARPGWSAQGLTEDRADSIVAVSDSVLGSSEGRRLWTALKNSTRGNPDLRQAFDLEERIQGNDRELSGLQSQKDLLELRQQSALGPATLEDLSRRLDTLQRNITRLRGENARLKSQKQALFKAKIIGAGFAAFSMFLQIQGVRDAIQRVRIKETDLARRQANLVDPATGGPGPDMLKLKMLEENSLRAQFNQQRLRAGGAGAAELLKAEKKALNAATELEQWKNVVANSQQKISEAKLTNQIDARSILRQKISVGLTAVGTLVIGLFGDRIILKLEEWLESDDPADQEERTLSYLRRWNAPRVILASMLPWLESQELDPSDKALVFFASSRELGLKKDVLEHSLLRYKTENPPGYAALQSTAEGRLQRDLKEQFERHLRHLRIEEEVRADLADPSRAFYRQSRQFARDATYVAPRVPPPMPAVRPVAPKKEGFFPRMWRSATRIVQSWF